MESPKLKLNWRTYGNFLDGSFEVGNIAGDNNDIGTFTSQQFRDCTTHSSGAAGHDDGLKNRESVKLICSCRGSSITFPFTGNLFLPEKKPILSIVKVAMKIPRQTRDQKSPNAIYEK